MNLDDIYSNTTLVFSHFDISVEELAALSALCVMEGNGELSNKINAIIDNINSVISIEEELEETQLKLF